MDPKRLKMFLQRIFETLEEEISCTECLDQVSSYVELELAGKKLELSLVRQHIHQCRVCREEYETLRDLLQSSA